MLEASRWRRLALAIGQISRPRSLAIGLIAAQPLWANATEQATTDESFTGLEETPTCTWTGCPNGS
ncbi:hypothetical protein [Microbulbifer taiwanensis]|uniref:hypothetical protein n=1 Tax=Microbulbifer taiwanensis TaxID=986746 RepID=UPI0036107E7F